MGYSGSRKLIYYERLRRDRETAMNTPNAMQCGNRTLETFTPSTLAQDPPNKNRTTLLIDAAEMLNTIVIRLDHGNSRIRYGRCHVTARSSP